MRSVGNGAGREFSYRGAFWFCAAAQRSLASEPGHLIIAGHRTSWFRPLEGVRKDNRVELDWFEPGRSGVHRRAYSVEAVRIADPTDTSLLKRFVVQAFPAAK